MQPVRARTDDLIEKNSRLAIEVAERKARESELRREKRFADEIINSLPGIFYVFDEHGRLVRWNLKLLEVTGYSDKEVRHLQPVEFFAGTDRARVRRAIREAFKRGETLVEAALMTRDRRRIPYYFTGRRTLLNGRPYVVGLGVDITDRIVLEKELETKAYTDPLTGVSNRRHFLELAESELARTRRYGGTLSLLMLDLDRFKAINDTHGHQVGDQVLQILGDTCRKVFRNIDVVGRIGGEEFAVLLPATDIKKAYEVAERLRRNIEQAEIPLDREHALHFTASIGVTGLEDRNADLGTLLNLADKALYRAKHGGRNRVATHQQHEPRKAA